MTLSLLTPLSRAGSCGEHRPYRAEPLDARLEHLARPDRHDGPERPGHTTSPARSGRSVRPSLVASQTAAFSGLPRHASPDPAETRSPSRVIVIAAARRSSPDSGIGVPPSTNAPAEALSAIVSAEGDVPVGDARVGDLDGGQGELHGPDHVGHGEGAAHQVAAENQGDLGLGARLQEPLDRDGQPVAVAHVGEQHAVVGRSTPICRWISGFVMPIFRPTGLLPASSARLVEIPYGVPVGLGADQVPDRARTACPNAPPRRAGRRPARVRPPPGTIRPASACSRRGDRGVRAGAASLSRPPASHHDRAPATRRRVVTLPETRPGGQLPVSLDHRDHGRWRTHGNCGEMSLLLVLFRPPGGAGDHGALPPPRPRRASRTPAHRSRRRRHRGRNRPLDLDDPHPLGRPAGRRPRPVRRPRRPCWKRRGRRPSCRWEATCWSSPHSARCCPSVRPGSHHSPGSRAWRPPPRSPSSSSSTAAASAGSAPSTMCWSIRRAPYWPRSSRADGGPRE